MSNILVVVDMQKDFIDGALGTREAVAIVPSVLHIVEHFEGTVIFTRDTHGEDYLTTMEGKNLSITHCVKDSEGWQIESSLQTYAVEHQCKIFDKPTFGSTELMEYLARLNKEEKIETVTFVGLCTDICVISNAILAKAALLDTRIQVKKTACAGVTPASHENAIMAMKACQIEII